jgi:hypothetical protein
MLGQGGESTGVISRSVLDLNVRHFQEKLYEQHQINPSYIWVKSVLQGNGLVRRHRQCGVHRKRQPRRAFHGTPAFTPTGRTDKCYPPCEPALISEAVQQQMRDPRDSREILIKGEHGRVMLQSNGRD